MMMDDSKFDKRTVGRKLGAGTVTAAGYKKYLNGLKDLAEECETSEISLYGTDGNSTGSSGSAELQDDGSESDEA